MWTVPKSDVADLLKLDLSARMQEAKEKARLFERTHQQSFEEFEHAVVNDEEAFEAWDDYIEWKAYRKLSRDLENKLSDLQRGDFEVA